MTNWTSDDPVYGIGDRVMTSAKLTLPEGFEVMHDLLAEQPGEVIDTHVYEIQVEGDDEPIKLATCKVQLDIFPENPLTFHPDELYLTR